MASDNVIEALIEFKVSDAPITMCRTLPSGESNQRRGNIVYTLVHRELYPDPVGWIAKRIVYERPQHLNSLVWRLGERYPRTKYWMAVHDEPKVLSALSETLSVAYETSPRYRSVGTDVPRSMLASVDYGADLHISCWAGCGHLPGFHLFALPEEGSSDIYLQDLLSTPDRHPGEIEALCWDAKMVLCDSLFEIRPFGDEESDNVEIALSKSISCALARQTLADVYDLPFVTIACTARELDMTPIDALCQAAWESIDAARADYNGRHEAGG